VHVKLRINKVTLFIVLCALMVAVALGWLLWPLIRPRESSVEERTRTRLERRVSSIALVVAIPSLALALYAHLSNWDWKTTTAQQAQTQSMERSLRELEAKLKGNPNDVEGWMLLGRTYVAIGQAPKAVPAFQRAFDLTSGADVNATIGLGEALALSDEASLQGRAGDLFSAALERAPNHPKALWYGSIAALMRGDLQLGRDRLQRLIAQDPPPQLREVLERQIQDINEQLGEGKGTPAAATNATASAEKRSIRVSVSVAPNIQKQLSAALPLFVLARDPNAGGPPLAVQRHSSSEAPLTVELSERDAMLPTRTIASVPKVQVVARISRSGSPQAQSGDFFGQATYEFSNERETLNIIVDQIVP
jgi:cytochrome c-type biogenesis protein CcmH